MNHKQLIINLLSFQYLNKYQIPLHSRCHIYILLKNKIIKFAKYLIMEEFFIFP